MRSYKQCNIQLFELIKCGSKKEFTCRCIINTSITIQITMRFSHKYKR